MANINAFTKIVNTDFEDPYEAFAAERDFDLIMRLNWDPDSVTKKEWDALRGDVACDEAQSDWYHNEVAKAKRGEFSLVRQIGNVTRLLIPQWSTAKAYRCEVIEFPTVTRAEPVIEAPTTSARIFEFPQTAHLTVTELRPTGSLFAGKEILRDNSIKSAPNIKNWRHRRVGFNNIEELFQYVSQVQYGNSIIVRDLTDATDEVIYKRKACTEKPENVFRDHSAALLPFDIDKIATPEEVWKQNPHEAVEAIVKRMGSPFTETSYVAYFTGTHGLVRDADGRWTGEIGGDVMRVRMLFITMRGLSNDEAKTWLEYLCYSAPDPIPEIDASLCHPHQIIYLARPKWHGHVDADPLGEMGKCWLAKKQFDRLPVPDDLPQRVRHAAQTGQGKTVIQHPDATTAVASIGLPLQGNSGQGSIYEHLKSAAVHLIDGNPINDTAIGVVRRGSAR